MGVQPVLCLTCGETYIHIFFSYRSPSGDGFHREGFGRQSMSEKRKGHIDPRSMETYQSLQRNKGANKDTNKGIYSLAFITLF